MNNSQLISELYAIKYALLALFDVGMAARMAYIFISNIGEDASFQKSIGNYVKAFIIANSFFALVLIIEGYFKG